MVPASLKAVETSSVVSASLTYCSSPGPGALGGSGCGSEWSPGPGTLSGSGCGSERSPGPGALSESGCGSERSPGPGALSESGCGLESSPGPGALSGYGCGSERSLGEGPEVEVDACWCQAAVSSLLAKSHRRAVPAMDRTSCVLPESGRTASHTEPEHSTTGPGTCEETRDTVLGFMGKMIKCSGPGIA
ncbi:hypothetical protein DPEC_G00140690 [Dallia pectoralis]|uniref:Uncharacterized protein n=1 Tax=Dallia pectoralis TaxID=75939 RepID=A0ACC2GMU3_DALPE|nr:hypothetical protein DPEC_G00140690 [Dallia pectoralis]